MDNLESGPGPGDDSVIDLGTFAPRLDISLKKDHDLEIWHWPTCRGILGDGIRKKNIFQPQVFYFNLQTCKYRVFSEKNLKTKS